MDEATRPAPATMRPTRRAAAPQWCVTLVFHPHARRIGEQARRACDGAAWWLGRGAPDFSVDGISSKTSADPAPIGDQRISRSAVRIEPADGNWTLHRPVGSSRLRVDGRHVDSAVTLSGEELRRGVFLTLAHTVLVHLQRDAAPPPAVLAAPAIAGMWGVSTALRRSLAAVHAAAERDVDVLFLGPTGVGKDVAARAVHALSARATGPWVPVNMAALAPDLAPASLFGVRRGAYTGADSHRPGFFQQARGGTLFLDEIADTPATLQAMLLRALQERELQVVGGPVEPVDLRVIAATERDIDAPDSDFRGALRYRLGAHEICIPALGERREDIAVIAARALAAEGVAWSPAPRAAAEVSRWAGVFESLVLRAWPGNVRELLHAVQQLASGGELDFRHAGKRAPGRVSEARARRLTDLSDEGFRARWRDCGYEVARMARRCGVSRQAVYRRLRQLEDCRLAADVPFDEIRAALHATSGDLDAAAQRLAVSLAGLRGRLRASGAEPASP